MQLFVSLFASWTSWVNSGLSYSVICILYYILCKCTTLHPACILNFYILDFIFEIYVFKNYLYFIFLHSTKEVLKKHPLHSGKSFIIVYFLWVLRENEMVVVTEPGDYRQVRPSTCLATFLCQSRDGERSGLVNALNTHHWHCQPARVNKNISVWYNRQQSLLHCLLVSYDLSIRTWENGQQRFLIKSPLEVFLPQSG